MGGGVEDYYGRFKRKARRSPASVGICRYVWLGISGREVTQLAA